MARHNSILLPLYLFLPFSPHLLKSFPELYTPLEFRQLYICHAWKLPKYWSDAKDLICVPLGRVDEGRQGQLGAQAPPQPEVQPQHLPRFLG